MTSREVAFFLKEIGERNKKEFKVKEYERQFYALIHGSKYELQVDLNSTDDQRENVAENNKQADAKIEAYMNKRMAEMKATATQDV